MENIKLVCFDLDKTLINQNSWYNLNLALGVTEEEDKKLFDEYYSGKLSYIEWTKRLLDIFLENKKASLETITKTLSNYSLDNKAREIVDYVKSKGYSVALISGSINILVELVANDLKIELASATNTFVFDENNNLKDIICLGDDKIAKLNVLEDYCQKLGIDLTECACVGDGDNDIELFLKTGHGITFKDSKIMGEAWKVINSLEDLKEIF